MTVILFILPLIALISTIIYAMKLVNGGKAPKTALFRQICAFAFVGLICCALTIPMSAANNVDTDNSSETTITTEAAATAAGMGYLAAAIVTGLSGIGGGIAVAAGAPAAIGATSEDPKAFGKALIFVALGEGIALYGLLVSILILAKV